MSGSGKFRGRRLLALLFVMAAVALIALPVYAAKEYWESEPNNGFGRADYLYGPMHGRLDEYDAGEQAIDFFLIDRVWQRNSLLELKVDGSEDGLRPRICLYNQNRRLVACSENETNVVDELNLVLPRKGKFYVSVEAAGECPGPGCTGRYTLTMSLAWPEWEPNDSFAGAMRVTVRSGFNVLASLDRHGQVPYPEDEDFIRIKSTYRTPETLTFRVESLEAGVVDPDICLYRRPDKLIGCSQTTGPDELTYQFNGREIIWAQVMADCDGPNNNCRGDYILRVFEP